MKETTQRGYIKVLPEVQFLGGVLPDTESGLIQT